ncbi:MAG: hypothetical protein WBG50_08390 [Desulfomonilaceae bacterium]
MKRLTLCLILGIFCAAIVSFAGAQQSTGKGKSTSKALPAEVCKAIEKYVAKVDSARSMNDKSSREKKYNQAQEDLAKVLTKYGKSALLSEASKYVLYTELVVGGDAKDVNLDQLIDQRLKKRTSLLEMCSPYTTKR